METLLNKIKEWLKENAPMLSAAYENKYVGMAYDRFASLPPKQQRQTLLAGTAGAFGLVFIILLSAYLTLWAESSRAKKSYEMVNLLLEHQKHRQEKGSQIQNLEKNNQLSPSGAFKAHLLEQGRAASISPRMLQIEEKEEMNEPEDTKASKDINLKIATVKLIRVNLEQLKNFLQNVEFGPYNLSISSIKITNDDKIRGYMNIEMGIVAYLFHSDENQ